jgi:hypothetical protein
MVLYYLNKMLLVKRYKRILLESPSIFAKLIRHETLGVEKE